MWMLIYLPTSLETILEILTPKFLVSFGMDLQKKILKNKKNQCHTFKCICDVDIHPNLKFAPFCLIRKLF